MAPDPDLLKAKKCECDGADVVVAYFDDNTLTILVHETGRREVDVSVFSAKPSEVDRFINTFIEKVLGKTCKCVDMLT